MLKNIAEAVSKVVGLNDPPTEQQNMAPDRTGVGGSHKFVSVDQALVTAARMGEYQHQIFPSNLDVPATMQSVNERFYLIYNHDWTNTHVFYQKLTHIGVFASLITTPYAMQGNLKAHTYMRAGVEVIVQANGNQFQMGALLCMLVPGNPDGISYSGFGMIPHGIINLNVNNAVRMEAPWVYTRGAYNINNPIQEPWHLVIIVLSELKFGSNVSTGCTISVMARFTNVELYGMRPITNMLAQEVRLATTSHIVNMGNARGSAARISLAIGDEKSLRDLSGSGGLKVDNFRMWTGTAGYIGRFAFNSSAEIGNRIATWNVNPYFYAVKDAGNYWHPPPATSVCQMFAYWRGDIVYYFQIVATRFHSGRLMFAFIPGNETTDIGSISMQRASSSMCATMDIQGVSSTCCFRIPYTADTHYRANIQLTSQTSGNLLRHHYHSIGKMMVFVYNKLRYPTNITPHVMVNVYMCLENAELICSMYSNLGGTQNIPTRAFDQIVLACAGDDEAQKHYEDTGAFSTPGVVSQDPAIHKTYDDVPQNQIPTGAVLSIEDPMQERQKPETFQAKPPGVPRHSVDQLDIYEYMGKGHFFFTYTLNKPISGGSTGGRKVFVVPLDIRRKSSGEKGLGGVLQWFFSMFHLYRGPLDMTIVLTGAVDADVAVWYTPPGQATAALWDQEENIPPVLTADYVSAFPMLRFNTRSTSAIQFRIPWYNDLHAVSAALDTTCDDTCMGYISVFANNYGTGDQRLGLAGYLSIPREAEMYVPRPNLRQNVIYPSNGNLGREGELLSGVETSVDFQQEEGPVARVPTMKMLIPENHLYRELRMNVGAHRLAYAFEELQKTEDVQSQAGHMFEDCDLVQRRHDGRLQRGFCYDGKIYTIEVRHKALLGISLVKNAAVVCVPQSGDWLCLNSKVELYLAQCFVGLWEDAIPFNYKAFSDGDYASAFGVEVFARISHAVEGRFDELAKIMLGKSLGVLDKVLHDTELMEEVSGTTTLVKEVLGECQTLMQQVQAAIKNLALAVSRKKSIIVTRIMTALLKTAIKLYVCIKTSWQPSVAIPMFTELLLDVGEFSLDMGGLMKELVHYVSDLFGGEVKAQSFGWARDAVACVSLFKSAKSCFDWLVLRFQEWYDSNYGVTRSKMERLLDVEEQVEALVTYADEVCTKQVIKKEDYEEAVQVLKRLRSVQSVVNSEEALRKLASPLGDVIRQMHLKLRGVSHDHTESCMRPEPTVVYIHGERGGGKSLLAMALAAKICMLHGCVPSKQIYTKPEGSQFWDGYNGQLVCIMDDIGQGTDDADWETFCQLVSCAPMRCNMAAIEDKGIHFTSPYIICTSNLTNPDPRTVYCREAITRRLHIRVEVRPKDYYLKEQSGVLALDVAKAHRDGLIKNMECVEILYEGKSVTLQDIVTIANDAGKSKRQLMDEFMQLWSQGAHPDSFQSFLDVVQRPSNGRCVNFFRALREHKIVIIGTMGAILAGMGIFYASYKFFQHNKEKKVVVEPEAAYTGVTKIKNVVKLGDQLHSQSMVDLASMVERNMVKFGISKDGETVSWRVNGLMFYENWMVVPYHAYRFETENVTHFFFVRNNTTYVVDRRRVTEVPATFCPDLVFMMVPGLPKCRDIREHFVKKADVDACNNRLATLATFNAGLFTIISEGDVTLRDGMTYTHQTPQGNKEIFIPHLWKGRGDAHPGSCGGVLISANNRLQNPFIGIHLAAGSGVMVSALVTREDLTNVGLVVTQSSRITQVAFVSETVSSGNKTSFRQSELYDHLPVPCSKAPAILFGNPKSELDVLSVAMSKFNTMESVEPDDFSNAAMSVLDLLLDVFGLPGYEILDEYSAIMGVPGMDGIDMTTGPGIPYVFKGLRKADLITDGKVIHPLLRHRVSDHLSNMALGISCDVTFQTCAKDELRDLEKVVNSKTRIIDVAPVCFTIAFRRMFGRAVARLQSNPGFDTGIAVGIDPDSGWHTLISEALTFGSKVLALDYRNFDASVSPYMIKWGVWILGYMNRIPEPVVNSTYVTLAYSTHQVANMQYKVRGSVPSGMPATSVLNSIINQVCVAYVLGKVLQVSPFDLRRVVRIIVYGDDLVLVWSRKYNHEALDLQRLVETFGSLGFTVTGADKGPPRWVDTLDLNFLKRGVRVDQYGVFHPTMSEATIWSLLQWRRKGAKLENNINDAMWFAYHHGPEFYRRVREAVMDAIYAVGLNLYVPEYELFEARFRSIIFRM